MLHEDHAANASLVQREMRYDADLRVAALRTGLHKLALLDRLIVALHFCAGLSNREISAQLTVPPATIIHRLQRAIDTLCMGMAQDGFSGEPDKARLADAICAGTPTPNGLFEKLQNRIACVRISMRETFSSAI